MKPSLAADEMFSEGGFMDLEEVPAQSANLNNGHSLIGDNVPSYSGHSNTSISPWIDYNNVSTHTANLHNQLLVDDTNTATAHSSNPTERFDSDSSGSSSGILMDLATNEKHVHADFYNDFDDLFDDDEDLPTNSNN